MLFCGFWDADLCSDLLVMLWLDRRGFQILFDSLPGALGKGFGLDIVVRLLLGDIRLESGDAGA